MIGFKNLVKRYGEKEVVKNVSLDLPKGQIVAFIGGNGAGKSTIISMISRLISRDEGEIYIDQKELKNWNTRELAKKIAVLNQSNHVNIRLKVRELVSFGRYPYSQDKLTDFDKEKVENAIEYMGITAIADSYLDELSGGQRQMAYIAMVIAQDTQYVIMDEPLNNLDMNRSVQIMKGLRKMVDELGKTVIIVIHDINFVSCYADYVVALKNGEIIHHGPKDEMITSKVLGDVYDMDIDIQQIAGDKICLYYQ